MTPTRPTSRWWRSAPALTLVVMAPLVAEVLPGATRFSSLRVLPIQMCVWGGGALLIRYAVRRARLGWLNMLMLALALAIAEECIIQQTSLAPLVIQIKGQTYARAFGFNYVYFLWALVYETVFVVFLPIHLVELIFRKQRERLWIGRIGLIVAGVLFLIGSRLAWYTWTHIARPVVFHLPTYDPPLTAFVLAIAAISGLIFVALGPWRNALVIMPRPLKPPLTWLLGAAGAIWAILWYGLALLAFGIAPTFPTWIAVGAALLLSSAVLTILPRWSADLRFQSRHEFAIVFGTMLGSMAAGFIGFIVSTPIDLYFKIIANVIAIGFMIALGISIKRELPADRNRNTIPAETG